MDFMDEQIYSDKQSMDTDMAQPEESSAALNAAFAPVTKQGSVSFVIAASGSTALKKRSRCFAAKAQRPWETNNR